MEVQCTNCNTRLEVDLPGTYKCSVCGELFTVPQQPVTPALQAVQPPIPPQYPTYFSKQSFFKRNFCKIKTWTIRAACAALIIAGAYFIYSLLAGKNALDYVPENADFVIYGNTHSLFDSKLWEIAEDHKEFNSEILSDLKDALGFSDVKDLDGNFAIWGHAQKDAEACAVLVLKKDNAEKIFNAIRSKLKEIYSNETYNEVIEKTIDGKSNITAYYKYPKYNASYSYSSSKPAKEEYERKASISVTMVDKNVLQFTFEQEQSTIFKPEKASKAANSINKSTVFAAAASPECFDKIAYLFKEESGIKTPIDQLGIAVLEVFMSKKEVEIRARVDISDLKK